MEIPVVILTIWHSVVLTEATCCTMKSECLQILFKTLIVDEFYQSNIVVCYSGPLSHRKECRCPIAEQMCLH